MVTRDDGSYLIARSFCKHSFFKAAAGQDDKLIRRGHQTRRKSLPGIFRRDMQQAIDTHAFRFEYGIRIDALQHVPLLGRRDEGYRTVVLQLDGEIAGTECIFAVIVAAIVFNPVKHIQAFLFV